MTRSMEGMRLMGRAMCHIACTSSFGQGRFVVVALAVEVFDVAWLWQLAPHLGGRREEEDAPFWF